MNRFLQLLVFTVITFNCVIVSPEIKAQAKPNNVNQGTYKTIFDMLRDVPGLEVRSNNTKSGGTVIVRGISSLNNQKPPLYVVDGTIYGGDITNINPQDVDVITVLKDAATAAAYGAQGAGGVISITTKKGGNSPNNAVVSNYDKSAYSYFIEHQTPLKVFGIDDQVIIKGVIQKQQDSTLVFMKKNKPVLVPIKDIKKVEMITE